MMKRASLLVQSDAIKLYHCPLLLSKAHCSAIGAEQKRRADKAFRASPSTIWPSRWEPSSAALLLIRTVAVLGHQRGLGHLARAVINPAQMNRDRGQSRKIKPHWRLVDFPLVCESVCVCEGGVGSLKIESIMLEMQNDLF